MTITAEKTKDTDSNTSNQGQRVHALSPYSKVLEENIGCNAVCKGEIMAERYLPLVRAKGTHFEVGKAIGEQCKKKIEDQIDFYSYLLKKEFSMSWKRAINRSKKYLPACEKVVPELLDELKGMAEGSGKTFDDLFALNCFEEILFESAQKKNACTGIAVSQDYTKDGCVYLGHNEDWLRGDLGNQVMIHASLEGEPEFIALAYGAVLPATGLNSAGIAHSANAQGHADFKEEGVPCMLVARKILSARNIDEAVDIARMPDRASGTNHLIADEKGAMYSIETSATQDNIIKNRKYAVHSNHYITHKMEKYNEEEDKDSLRRYGLARELVSKELKQIDYKLLKTILSNHGDGSAIQPDPYALCQHATRAYSPMDEDETISSIIINLTTKTVWACKGNPCKNNFKEYKFEIHEEKEGAAKEEQKEEKKEAKVEKKEEIKEGKPEKKDEKEKIEEKEKKTEADPRKTEIPKIEDKQEKSIERKQ